MLQDFSEEKIYWLGFSAFPGIGPLRFKLLLKYFKSAKRAWLASGSELKEIGLGGKLTDKFIDFRKNFDSDDFIKNLKQKNIIVVLQKEKEYPSLLKEISDAPILLYIRGNLNWDISKTIGVVGTRKVTDYGEKITYRLTQELVSRGLTIVSGMAYGVDTVSHRAAIDAGGKTIAVLGCGVDVIHPKSNTELYWEIVRDKGIIVSEFPPGHFADRGLFPARNRIISGLSLGVVVTEGASDSGSLITARYAANQGREVFAVPGSITSKYSKGPTILLKQGAKLVTEASDVLEELDIKNKPITQLSNKPISNIKLSEEELNIIKLLEQEDLHFDELVKRTKIKTEKLGSILSMMELKNIIRMKSAGVYQITS